MLKLTILITLLVGVVCSYIISRRLASPIAKLSEEVAEAQGSRDKIPKLSFRIQVSGNWISLPMRSYR